MLLGKTVSFGEIGKYYFTRNGSTLLAFAVGGAYDTEKSGFIVVGAHTDSPCPKQRTPREDIRDSRRASLCDANCGSFPFALSTRRLKPVSKLEKSGSLMLGVVGYGGGIWHSWFDRDLTLVGRSVQPQYRVKILVGV